MGKISDFYLRAQAVILAKEGYSCSRIATKLRRSKSWVSKWICRGKDNDMLVDKKESVVQRYCLTIILDITDS